MRHSAQVPTVDYLFACVCVRDRDLAASWYERFFGRPPDMLPNDLEAAWQLTPTSSLYLLQDTEHAGHAMATLVVADLGARLDTLASRGIVAGAIQEVGSAGWKSEVLDPDGNIVSLVQLRPAL